MFTRIFSVGLLPLALAACNDLVPDKVAEVKAREHQNAIAEAEGLIPCAPSGRSEMRTECAVDRVQTQDGLYLTLRHPDGGFHRLLVTRDGRGVVAADGAEDARVTPLGDDRIEVAVGSARYQLPATVKPGVAEAAPAR